MLTKNVYMLTLTEDVSMLTERLPYQARADTDAKDKAGST
jgi:hypothetical protein